MDIIDYELKYDPNRVADRVTDAVLKEVGGRKGFKWHDLPEDIREEFAQACKDAGRKAISERSS